MLTKNGRSYVALLKDTYLFLVVDYINIKWCITKNGGLINWKYLNTFLTLGVKSK